MQPNTVEARVRETPPPEKVPWRLLIGLGFGVVGLLVLVGTGLFILVRAPSAPRGTIDNPTAGETIADTIDVYGWAVDLGATGNSGVDHVELYLDGTSMGEAQYGLQRPDLATSFGTPFATAGFTARLDPHNLRPGQHTLEARAHSRLTNSLTSYTQTFVYRPPSAPVGHLDWPEEGASVDAGVSDVRGWAIDTLATTDSGVDQVHLYVDGALVGTADYGQERDELGTAYGDRFLHCGFTGRVDLSGLAPGPHVLEARAHSTLTLDDTTYTTHIVLVQP